MSQVALTLMNTNFRGENYSWTKNNPNKGLFVVILTTLAQVHQVNLSIFYLPISFQATLKHHW